MFFLHSLFILIITHYFSIRSVIQLNSTQFTFCFVPRTSLLENTDDYCHMLSLVVMESEKELVEMESADRITDRETMRKIIHRMMPVWEMLGKDNILRDFQRILHDCDSQNETVHKHAIQIMEWLKKLIEETKNELKKYENPHS